MLQTIRTFFYNISLPFTGSRSKEPINKKYTFRAFLDLRDCQGYENHLRAEILNYFAAKGEKLESPQVVINRETSKVFFNIVGSAFFHIELRAINAQFNEDNFLKWFKQENPELLLR